MNWIRVGDVFINLSLVTEVVTQPSSPEPRATVYYAVPQGNSEEFGEVSRKFEGEEADMLTHFFEHTLGATNVYIRPTEAERNTQ